VEVITTINGIEIDSTFPVLRSNTQSKKACNYRVKISTTPDVMRFRNRIVVFSSCKLSEETEYTSSLHLFPNPTSGNVTLELTLGNEETRVAQVQLVNMLGQVIKNSEWKVENGKLSREMQLSDIAEGMYLSN
jgi:hypothetical protein